MRLSEIVRPDIRIARSVNLERDLGDPESLDRYLLTGKGLEIIGRLAAGLNGEKVSAWSLTGPYGMGKSAFVRFLLSLCGDFRAETTGTARQMLARKSPDLSERFLGVMKSRRVDRVGFFQVAATAAFEPINRTLADALARAASPTPCRPFCGRNPWTRTADRPPLSGRSGCTTIFWARPRPWPSAVPARADGWKSTRWWRARGTCPIPSGNC